MDWFEQLVGFPEDIGEGGYLRTRERLEVRGRRLRSRVNGKDYGIGELELVDLRELRERTEAGGAVAGQRRVRLVQADVGALHRDPAHEGALFQVASQFNLLEMVGPHVTPDDGVTCYAGDHTQGPACAIAAGAATVYRNYFVPVGEQVGQTRDRQIEAFSVLGEALAAGVQRPAASLWFTRNGYVLFERESVDRLSHYLSGLDVMGRSALRDQLKIGLHWDVEVTASVSSPGPRVSQAFCSALPVSYCPGARGADWEPLATLVLEAAYEATLWAAVLNAQRSGSRTVLLTQLGGGAFGNDAAWIRAAIGSALRRVDGHGLDVVIVSHGAPAAELREWVKTLQ